jgi:hypothetical protein
MNLVNNAKFDMIEDLNNLIGTANIKGFWVFDQTGATTSVTGRQPANTGGSVLPSTLSGNASTLVPAVTGLAPNLTFVAASNNYWYAADNADFSFGNGTTDSAYSIIVLCAPTLSLTTNTIFAKAAFANNAEYFIFFDSANKLNMRNYKTSDTSIYIGRLYNTALTADSGVFHCYIFTYDGSGAVAGMKIYRDGVQVDDTTLSNGAYTAMNNGTQNVGNYYLSGSNAYGSAKYAVNGIVSKELTAAECKRVSDRLRAYAGTFL